MDATKLAEHLYRNMLTPAQLEQIANGTPVVITAPDGKSTFQFTRNNEGKTTWTQSEIVAKPKATTEKLANTHNAVGKVPATNTANSLEKESEELSGNKTDPAVIQPLDNYYQGTVESEDANTDTVAQKQKMLSEQARNAQIVRNNAELNDFETVYGEYKPTNYNYSNATYNKAGEILGDTDELNQLRGTLAKNPHTQYNQNPTANIGIATDETYNNTNTKQIIANLKEIKKNKDIYALDTVNAYRSQALNYLASVDRKALDACIQNGQYSILKLRDYFRRFQLNAWGNTAEQAVNVLAAADDTRKVLLDEQKKLVTNVNPAQLEKTGTYTQNETELDYQRGIADGTAIAQYNMAKLQMTAQARELSGMLYEYAHANKNRYPAINNELKALNAEITTRLNNINGYNTAINQALAKVDSRAGIAPDYVKAVYFTIASQALRDYTLLPEARQFYEEMLANNQVNSPTVAAAGTTADIAGKAYKGVK